MKCLWICCLWLTLSCANSSKPTSSRERFTERTNGTKTRMSDAQLDAIINDAFEEFEVSTTTTTVNDSVTPIPPKKSENIEDAGDDAYEMKGCTCETGNCICVPYYLCDANRTIIADGGGLVDIRMNGECDYLELCCSTGQVLPPDQPLTQAPSIPEPSLEPFEQSENNVQPVEPEDYEPPTSGYESVAPVCGKRNGNGVSTLRITGNYNGETQFGEFPWMVAIVQKNVRIGQETMNVYQCGGSLISPGVVLTGAHCVEGKNNLMAIAGEWDTRRSVEPLPKQTRAVRHIVIHENYSARTLVNNVALLFLEKAMDLGFPHVGTICLPEQDENMDDRLCVASGWGRDDFDQKGRYQVILKKVDLPTVKRETCARALRQSRLGPFFRLHSSFICAGGERGKDACKGDGGGPLACPSRTNPNVYVQAGIVSWGVGCGTETPGVYVNVAKFRNWIDERLINDFEPRYK